VVAVDNANNITVAGRYTGTVDLDPGPGSFNVSSASFSFVFLASYSEAGLFRWGNNLGNGAGTSYAYDLHVDEDAGVYLNWNFLSNGIISKFDSAGFSAYTKGISSMNSIYNHGMHVERSDVFYSGGGFRNSLLTDSTFLSGGSGFSAYLIRYADCLPPQITSQSASSSVCEESTLSISINAIGTDIQYQWYKDSVFIDTTEVLVLNNITLNDSGMYYCIVTGLCGADTSAAIYITVNTNPVVSIIDSSGMIHATPGLVTYNWYLNNSLLPFATSSITPLQPGAYYAIAGNTAGCFDTSNIIVLTAIESIDGPFLTMYPVPARKELKIVFKKRIAGTMALTDASGKIVIRQSVDGDELILDCGRIPAGLYSISIIIDDKLFSKKLILH
jgi:hypothetical protein